MTDWKRKLAAYLHDPPEKAYDFGPHHQARAKIHAESFGVAELWSHMGGNPDWSAAAADRFVFPHGSKAGGLGEDERAVFTHPMSGRRNGKPSLPADGLPFPGQADAEEWLGDIRPEWKSDDPQTQFLRAWRFWSEYAASHHKGAGKGAELLPYLPADTRIPDASIWHHCAVVSALEATRPGEDLKAALQPAFLLFQVGPVQDFIAQARSTRDLWSGSYLLSWMMMHAIKAVADQCGPDAVIFPSLKGQALYDFLETRLDACPAHDQVLVPGIPNRFLAVVPDSLEGEKVVRGAFANEWNLIARECRAWLKARGVDVHETLWTEQTANHWQITWQVWPWQSADEALAAFKTRPLGEANSIHLAEKIALAIPQAHRDGRCYRNGKLDPGWAWSAHYQLCQHALDARRTLRDFAPIGFDPARKPGHRDAFSGREEAVVQADHLGKAAHEDIRHLFRHAEPLGAANLIKRVWHRAYLARLSDVQEKKHLRNLNRARESFDSVPAVAAGAFAQRLFAKTAAGELRDKWLAFASSASAARESFPDTIAAFEQANEKQWLNRSDHSMFFPDVWQREINRRNKDDASQFYHPPEARPRLAEAEAALRALLKAADGQPSRYYAVLALDGDQVGKWLSGERSPNVQAVLSPKAAEYFRTEMLNSMTASEREAFAANLKAAALHLTKPANWDEAWPPQSPEAWIKAWLASPRPLSPSWHLQFSEALANFGLWVVRHIVEDVHHGQLIYSGGDDVLAMLPAEDAIECATNLRAAFQGRRNELSADAQELFRADAPEGFLWLANPQKHEPSWPLFMPGPRMTVSVGVAIGHVKEPLQDLIQEAQKAERRAKADPEKQVFDRSNPDLTQRREAWKPSEGWGRDALAVTLFKRSGETIRWGAKFGSSAFGLLNYLCEHFRAPWDQADQTTAISGRFPYRLAALLSVYDADKPLTDDLVAIAKKEIEHVISRQTLSDEAAQKAGTDFRRQDLQALCETFLKELCAFAWQREKNAAPSEKETVRAPRPLREFINLFLTEAFIRRQAD